MAPIPDHSKNDLFKAPSLPFAISAENGRDTLTDVNLAFKGLEIIEGQPLEYP